MPHYHAIVWIDHQKGTVWQFTATEQENTVVHAHGQHKAAADQKFFEEVAHALAGAHEILIIGPAQTKQEFAGFLRDKHAELGRGIVAVQNADHPTEPEVLAYARRHFAAIDRMFSADSQPGH